MPSYFWLLGLLILNNDTYHFTVVQKETSRCIYLLCDVCQLPYDVSRLLNNVVIQYV